jgi:transcriptional regulator with XRE-family HTH domain
VSFIRCDRRGAYQLGEKLEAEKGLMEDNDADDYVFLGPALAALRKRREMTVRAVSAKIKRSYGVISRYEQGEREIGSRDLLKYLKAVRASLADLQNVMRILRMLRSGSEWEPEPNGDPTEENDQ